jgi:hypothetical protein
LRPQSFYTEKKKSCSYQCIQIAFPLHERFSAQLRQPTSSREWEVRQDQSLAQAASQGNRAVCQVCQVCPVTTENSLLIEPVEFGR